MCTNFTHNSNLQHRFYFNFSNLIRHKNYTFPFYFIFQVNPLEILSGVRFCVEYLCFNFALEVTLSFIDDAVMSK